MIEKEWSAGGESVLGTPRVGAVGDGQDAGGEREQGQGSERQRNAATDAKGEAEHNREREVEVLLDAERPAHGWRSESCGFIHPDR